MLNVSKRMIALVGVAALIAIGLSPIKPAQSEESEPRKELTGVGDNGVLVQIVGDIEVLQVVIRSNTPQMNWRCSSQLRKVAEDLWSGKLAAPHGPKIDSLEVTLEFEISAAGTKGWIKLGRPLYEFYSIKAADLRSDPKKPMDFVACRVVEIVFEFQFDKEQSKDWKEVKLWHHWLVGSGPHSKSLVGLGDGRWVFRGLAFSEDEPKDYLELPGWLEVDGIGGDYSKATPKPVKDLGAKVLQVN